MNRKYALSLALAALLLLSIALSGMAAVTTTGAFSQTKAEKEAVYQVGTAVYKDAVNSFNDGVTAYHFITQDANYVDGSTVNKEFTVNGITATYSVKVHRLPAYVADATNAANKGLGSIEGLIAANSTVFIDEGTYRDDLSYYPFSGKANVSLVGQDGKAPTLVRAPLKDGYVGYDAYVAAGFGESLLRHGFQWANSYWQNLVLDGGGKEMLPFQPLAGVNGSRNRGEYFMSVHGGSDGLVFRDLTFQNIGTSSTDTPANKNVAINFYLAHDGANSAQKNIENITIKDTVLTKTGLGYVSTNQANGVYIRGLTTEVADQKVYPIKVEHAATTLAIGNNQAVIDGDLNLHLDLIYIQDIRYALNLVPAAYRYVYYRTANGSTGSPSMLVGKEYKDPATLLAGTAQASSNFNVFDRQENVWIIDESFARPVNDQLQDLSTDIIGTEFWGSYYGGNLRIRADGKIPPVHIKYVAKDGDIDGFNVPAFRDLPVHIFAVDYLSDSPASTDLVPVKDGATFNLGPSAANVKLYNFDFDQFASYTLQEAVYGTIATGDAGAVVPADPYNNSYDKSLNPRLDLTAGSGYASTQVAKVTGALQGPSYDSFQNCVFTQLVDDLEREGASINTQQNIDLGSLAAGSTLNLGVTAKGTYSSNPALLSTRIAANPLGISEGAGDTNLYFLSSNPSVATVDALTGMVTAVAPGQAYIYVKAEDQYNQGELEKPYARFKVAVPTSFTATKTWDNSPYTPRTLLNPPAEIPAVPTADAREDIYFQLMVKVKGSGASPTAVGAPVPLPKTNELITHTWSDLPAADANGKELEYSAREYTRNSDGSFGLAGIHNYITWQKGPGEIVNIFKPSLDGNLSTPCHLHWYLESLTEKSREIYVDSNHNFLYSVHTEGEGLAQIQHWRWEKITDSVNWRIPFAFSLPVKNLVIKMTLQENWTLNPDSFEITGASALYRHTGSVPELYTTIDRSTVEKVSFVDGNIEVHVKNVPAMTAFTLNFNGKHKEGSAEDYYLGLDVTGDYSCVSASKTWLGGEAPYPTVQMQLMRKVEGESEPLQMADAIEAYLNSKSGQPLWYKRNPAAIPGQPSYDPDADPYLYSDALVDILGTFPEEGRLIIGHLTLAADNAGTDPFLYEEALADALIAELTSKAQARYTRDIADPGDGSNRNGTGWNRLAFTDLDGKPVEYTVKELLPIPGYVPAGEPVRTVDPDNAEKIHFAFTNVKVEDIIATKTWSGGPEADHKAPAFTLKRDGVALEPQPAVAISPASGTAASFTYTWAEQPLTDADGKAYAYTVEEEGVTAGKLLVNGNTYGVAAEGLKITNTYEPPAKVTVELTARKAYQGATLEAGLFSFQLLAEDKATVLQDGVKNAADGSVSFDPVAFEAPGEYQFHIKEIQGSAIGVSYDAAVYSLRFKVSIAAGNKLEAELTELLKDGAAIDKASPILFTNKYAAPTPVPTASPAPTPEPTATPTTAPTPTLIPVEPEPTYPTLYVPLRAKKVLHNGSLQGGDFSFLLKDGSGRVRATVSNAADGTVVFPDRGFSRVVNNYIYTITEKAGAEAGMSYDGTVYKLKISTRAVDGKLEATIDVEKDGTPYAGEMVFTNRRAAPPTGDSLFMTIALMAGGAVLLGGLALLGRKRREAQG